MRFEEIYYKAISAWPKEIDISDGEILTDDGFYSSNLSFGWDIAEQNIDQDDEWQNLMIWSIFKVLHVRSKELFQCKVECLTLEVLDTTEVEMQFYKDLQEEGYEDMLKIYIQE